MQHGVFYFFGASGSMVGWRAYKRVRAERGPEGVAFAARSNVNFLVMHDSRSDPKLSLLKASLIHRAGPGGVVMGMPALRMGDADPAEDLGKFPIMSRQEEEMPVIGHQAVGGDADLGLGLGFVENLLKGGVVSGFVEERQPSDTTVQDMMREVFSSKAWAGWHDGVLSNAL